MTTKTQETTKPEETTNGYQGYFPNAKLAAVTRFKSITESLLPKSQPKPEVVFPPPSWDIKDFHPSSTNWTIPTAAYVPASPPADESAAESNKKEEAQSPPEPEEPITFAKRLRSMIELLPNPGSLVPDSLSMATSKTETQPPNGTADSQESSEAPPIPPGMDKNLIKMLSSDEVMNGGNDGKGKGRPSVWNLLAGLRRGEGSKSEAHAAPVEEEDSGVMMYAPLVPHSDSVVELAQTETVHSPESSSTTKPSGSNPDLPAGTTKEVRLWVPSTTEMSVLTTWWGYRLYLPPPVMRKLGASSVEAAARAAMITSALKWMIDKIPLLLIPVQFRPAVKMLKSLTPFAGYVGVFIAWSWDRIRTFDEGNGVVLTASWVLPVALVPMSWDAGDIYGPRLPSEIEEKKEEERKAAKPTEKKKSRFVWGSSN
ncbi:hypothetical protein BKA70DRAFT_1367605 [Coprinopsis sp. MPI-PUGE-AT-0042]|nr:hypothetical protein BKA70DRAFT_1367605 [Coprinopsis sp. MPI-PUGE-AT-0042]